MERSERRLEAPPQALVDTDQEVILEDDVRGDQVMMVKKISRGTAEGNKVRATREEVDRCEDEARRP